MSSSGVSPRPMAEPADKSESEGHRGLRLRAIIHGTVTGVAGRGVALVVSVLSIPLTIHYLGTERFGIWALVGSILAWLRLADIGIGNGLNNAVSHAFGSDDMDAVRRHVSTAFVLMTGISAALGVVLLLVWHWIDWVALFDLSSPQAIHEVGPAMACAAVVFLLSFPLSISTRVYTALQQGAVANAWQATSNIASLLALLVVTHTHGGLPWLVIALSGSALVVDAVSTAWLFRLRRRKPIRPSYHHFDRGSVGTLLSTGGQFFLIQIMALIVFESDNFVIAHFLGADHVASYSVPYKLFNYSTLIQTLLFAYVWVAYSEAMARDDYAWVRRAFRKNVLISLGVTAAAVIPLLLLAKPVVRVWAGPEVVPTTTLVLLLAGWNMVNAYCSPLACLFAASAHMKAQVVYSAVATAVNLALSIYLVQHWGVAGVIAATLISYTALICAPATIDAALLLKRMP